MLECEFLSAFGMSVCAFAHTHTQPHEEREKEKEHGLSSLEQAITESKESTNEQQSKAQKNWKTNEI